MRRLISGGEAPIVKGGTAPGAATRAADQRSAEDMSHARKVEGMIKHRLQPKTQAGDPTRKPGQ
jgi:hypothetical protein